MRPTTVFGKDPIERWLRSHPAGWRRLHLPVRATLTTILHYTEQTLLQPQRRPRDVDMDVDVAGSSKKKCTTERYLSDCGCISTDTAKQHSA